MGIGGNVNNKSSMKEKLLKLLWDLENYKYPDYDKKADEILLLFNVSGQSKQLVCTFCGINPIDEVCKHPKVCSEKKKVKAN